MAAPFSAASVQKSTLMEGADIRVLVALEDDYRAYRETLAAVLKVMRPGIEVESTTIGALKEALGRFDPQVVICGGREDVEPEEHIAAWIELSLEDPTQPTKISVGSRYLELINPGVQPLLEVVDGLEGTHRN